MHGRVKVRTTEEQAAAKRKEQEEKLKIYQKTTSKIFSKRTNGEYDEEALQLTGSLLEHNPDFYTLWNYRKEILLNMKPEKSVDEVKGLCSTEMNLTQHCLQKNPKSYGAWHHRFWTMEFNPEADWKKELKLCNFFLSQDERNFHCWDYRRQVAKKCAVSPSEELDYSTELIESNFSNYSAWHYRSTLLPIVYPGSTKGSLQEDVLLKELNLVQNAAFTDPDDQSVWFYHRWLLGRSKVPLQILNISVIKSLELVAVLLSEPYEVSKILTLLVNGTVKDVTWKSVSAGIPVSSVWLCKIPDDVKGNSNYEVSVKLMKEEFTSSLSCAVSDELSYAWCKTSRADAFRSVLSAAAKEVLESELESCQQLLEMEPDSKWTLFTCILLMRALNDTSFQPVIQEMMKKLKVVDPARKNYYDDLESKIVIEDLIENLCLDSREVDLSDRSLTSLYHCEHFLLIETLNLSSNRLKSIFPLCHLICLKNLIVDDNMLTNFSGLNVVQDLRKISAKKNSIQNIEDLEPLLSCQKIEEVYIEDNPITTDPTKNYLSLLRRLPAINKIEPCDFEIRES